MAAVYKRAFKCAKCPRNNTEDGCPAWTEFMVHSVATGEDTMHRQCIFQALPVLLTHVIKASNRPAAAIESTRNEIAKGLAKVAVAMPMLAHGMGPSTDQEEPDAGGPVE